MSDEGFHEIQLNGKQLVFLFMAATVVSVVIFLCGVMVGRGVRDRAVSAASSDPPEAANATATPGASAAGEAATSAGTPPAQAAAPPADQTPPTPGEEDGDDDYYNRLVKDQKDTSLAPKARGAPAAAKTPAKPSEPAKSPDPPPARKSPAPAASSSAGAPPAVAERGSGGTGYAVQLVAVRERGEADAIAKRLVAKGYQAYVLVPEPGKPPVYRVQVGRFKSRGDADKVAARLRKEEQFKPWVTR
jgi:cell division septation protein DedD